MNQLEAETIALKLLESKELEVVDRTFLECVDRSCMVAMDEAKYTFYVVLYDFDPVDFPDDIDDARKCRVFEEAMGSSCMPELPEGTVWSWSLMQLSMTLGRSGGNVSVRMRISEFDELTTVEDLES